MQDVRESAGNQSAGPKYFSLSQVAASVKRLVEANTGEYWISAEVVRLNYYPLTGYAIPELAEKEGDKIVAQMRATIWKEIFQSINQRFREVTGEPLSDGMRILFRASLSYHPIYGMSLNIRDVEPAFTLGELARKRKETIDRLKQEGIFNRNRQLEFPAIPRRLAVISVETSKGFSDFMRILEQNAHGYRFDPVLFTAIMQGERAVSTITAQTEAIGARKNQFDAVLIIRGGGDETGLTCYDEYLLARAVALCPLPVVSGIGHSTNESVTDMVSAFNKITPTDAAYFLIDCYREQEERQLELTMDLVNAARNFVQHRQQDLRNLAGDTGIAVRRNLSRNEQRLVRFSSGISGQTHQYTRQQRRWIADGSHKMMINSGRLLRAEHESLNQGMAVIGQSVPRLLRNSTNQLQHLERTMKLMHPENILQKGYAIVSMNNKAVTDAQTVPEGSELHIRVFKGKLRAIVQPNTNNHE
jgi:exodeoxyribonuclease VII large subunit